jgi:hypothetical protein
MFRPVLVVGILQFRKCRNRLPKPEMIVKDLVKVIDAQIQGNEDGSSRITGGFIQLEGRLSQVVSALKRTYSIRWSYTLQRTQRVRWDVDDAIGEEAHYCMPIFVSFYVTHCLLLRLIDLQSLSFTRVGLVDVETKSNRVIHHELRWIKEFA